MASTSAGRAGSSKGPSAKPPVAKDSRTKSSGAKTPRSRPAQLRGAAMQRAMRHLSDADAILAQLIAEYGTLPPERDGRPARGDHYGALLRSIVNQQLSVGAARAIYTRMLDRYGGHPPTPEQILADDPEELRLAVGISRPKAGYLRSLAEHVLAGELELELLDELPDEQVIAELVAVKGLGEWTAHMFLMFQLERPDVLAVGDLGVRRAIERAYSLQELPDRETMERMGEPWRPHRTLACRYLWRSLDNEP